MKPPQPQTDAEHRTHVAAELRAFAALIESEPAPRPLLTPLLRARRALTRFEGHLEVEAGLPKGFRCLHCNEPFHEDYMVENAVWREAVPDVAERYAAMIAEGLPKHGLYLHLRCLEARLGRRVTLADLSKAPCNDSIRYFFGRDPLDLKKPEG